MEAATFDWALIGLFLGASLAAGLTGWMFKPGDWYESLTKPDWRPKNWMFPVAWTTIYVLSSLAATRVAGQPGNAFPMAFWALQIALKVGIAHRVHPRNACLAQKTHQRCNGREQQVFTRSNAHAVELVHIGQRRL